MANFKDYTKFAASYCSNVPTLVFARAMLTASRQYFTKTQAWQESYEIALLPDVNEYETPLPYDCVAIDTVISATIDGKPLHATTSSMSTASNTKSTPTLFMNPNKDLVIFSPTPAKAGLVEITYSLKPSIDTEEMPDGLFDDHFEGLIAGTVFELKRMRGKDWSDPAGAGDFLIEFNAFIDQKRIELMQGNNNAELRIDYSMGNY
jgi:hypothetical protein